MEKLAIKLLGVAENFKKSPLIFVKQNINIIIILPALFGGLWQVVELASMSFSFLRFFSVGQIIPDGLLILLFLISFFISTLIILHFLRKFDSETDNEAERQILPKKGNAIYALVLFVFSFAFIFGLIFIDLYFIDNIDSLVTLIFYLPVNIIVAVIFLMTLYYSAFHCKELKNWWKPLKEVILGFKPLSFIIPSAMFILFIFRFHDAFTFPIELKNVENLVCRMEKVDESANIKLLYSNDKYIFIKCDVFTKDWKGKARTSEIRIFQFEELFDDSACVGSKRIRAGFVKDSIWNSKLPKVLKDTYARDSKSIEALKKYAEGYNPTKIDLSADNSINDYNIEFIIFGDKYANQKALKDEITNMFLLKLYLFHLKKSHHGYDLLSMRKGQAQFIIDYFIKSNNIESGIEMLNSGYPYILLSKSKQRKGKEIQDLIKKIKEVELEIKTN